MQFFNLKARDFPAALDAIEEAAGYHFRDRGQLVSALTHSSYSAEFPEHPQPCNERLEFLGDAVLQLIVTEALMQDFPQGTEGDLTRFRSTLVDEVANAGYARRLGLAPAMLLGHGECITGGRERQALQGDLFEAFLGAVYQDGGLDAARAVFQALVPEAGRSALTIGPQRNPKGTLNNYVQSVEHDTPKYIELSCSGPVHAPTFEYAVQVHSVEVGRGSARSKHGAEEAAARAALAHYNLLPPEEPPAATPEPQDNPPEPSDDSGVK